MIVVNRTLLGASLSLGGEIAVRMAFVIERVTDYFFREHPELPRELVAAVGERESVA